MTRQDIVSPSTPTQAITSMGPVSPSPSSILSNYTFPPSRKRALTATPTIIPSSPRSPRSPSLSFVPQIKKSTSTSSSPQHSKSQNSTSFNHPITSPRNSPPPDFLLDDDPFANLTGVVGSGVKVNRQLSARANGGVVRSPPRSRLHNDDNKSGREDTVATGSATKTSPSRATTKTSPSRITTVTTPASPPPKVTTTPPSNNTTPTSTSPISPKFPGFSGSGMRSSFSSIDSSTTPGWSISQPQSQLPLPKSPPPITRSPHYHSSPSSPPPPPPPSHNVLPLPHRPSPAHQRPAFKSRPSLPSLNTLAKMNFVPGAGFGARKVRKGKVGAGLPFEPWNNLSSGPNSSGETSPVLMEEAEAEVETGIETGGNKILPPFPTLVSVMESASTSPHQDQDFPPSPPPKDPSSSLVPSSSSPTDDDDDDVDQFMDQFIIEHYDRVDSNTDENETIMSISSTRPLAATSLVGSENTICDSPTLPLFPDTTSAILAPTLRPRTKIRTTTNDNQTNDSPLPHDSYRYTYPHPSSPQIREMEIELERLTSVSIPSMSDSTPPASATWSPSESASVSRSRSFSSTYTTLSFGSESESSCTRSSVDDDETHRYSNGIQQQHLPPQQQPSMLDPVLQAEVSVLESPPPLSMPFSGSNEDIGYIVSVPGPFPVHRGPLLSSNTDRDDNDTKTNDGSTPTTYLPYHDDDDLHIEDKSGEAVGEGFNPREVWMEDEVLLQKREEGFMRKEKVGHDEVEWEYIVGDQAITGSDGKLDVDGHAVAIVTPDPIPPDMKPETKEYSPPPLSTTTLTMPSMVLSTSHSALKDEIASGSSTAAAAALAMSTWQQDPSELVQDSSSSTHGLRTQLSSTPSIRSTSRPSSRFPTVSSEGQSGFFESEDEEEEEEEEEEPDEDHQEDEDDDIPLAKRIPSALTAQMSIRHQVRQEREKKKQEKVLRGQAETARTRLMTLRPTGSPSSSQPNQHLDQQQQQQHPTRSRHHTLTGKGSISLNPFSPEDLARKLRDINRLDDVESISNSAPVDATSWYQQQQRALNSRHPSKSMTRSLGDIYTTSPIEALPPMPHFDSLTLHAQRTKSIKELSSFHHHYHTSPSPTPTAIIPSHHVHNRSLSRSRSSLERTSVTIPGPVPPVPTARIAYDDHHKSFKSHQPSSSSSRAVPIRISADVDNPVRAASYRRRQVPVPVPAIPSSTLSSPAHPSPVITSSKPELVVQQRVFISSMQRFNMVEIGVSTTAGDVIEMIEAEGSLKDFGGKVGGWMVFEVAQDFGMERPIRSFELVTDVQASWNKDKMVNYLVLRMTPLEVPLNRSAIPSSSPTHSGYVEWEAKRGKWSKRFMQLREHSIWLSKRDNGQDQVHLCSLSNFDVYRVTRTHRAPKPFAFALKSTDNLSLFENTADYLHSFACSEKDGKIWMEKILVARSYVLFQERHVLFNSKAVNYGNTSSSLSRSGTRKAIVQRPHLDVFEPGSLLSKQL